eukprot:scaffold8225_cov129-Isochrysis_galbana.AAC.5
MNCDPPSVRCAGSGGATRRSSAATPHLLAIAVLARSRRELPVAPLGDPILFLGQPSWMCTFKQYLG